MYSTSETKLPDKSRYPQIPATVWWGVRGLLAKSPSVTLTESYLAAELGVQPTAAKQYKAELSAAGILDEEGKATPLAKRWRLPDSYTAAVDELMGQVYPEELLSLAPPSEGDRLKATRWFMQAGLGQGAAGNKAATYMLLGSSEPGEAIPKPGSSKSSGKSKIVPLLHKQKTGRPREGSGGAAGEQSSDSTGPASMPLNVNLQVHIGADAGVEQIEAIFSAMRRYLYDKPTA